ncbi:CwfJ C-terminus 1-domain-containing protein-like protein [Hyaloraphidium curvatum]|nr:CwfJ C-terminus 1-domain-containing protein-like protein [Hyaloraphidium curvatum]
MAAEGAPAARVLLVGGIRGRFRSFASRVAAIEAKHGPFELCASVGPVFADGDGTAAERAELADLLGGNIKVPLPTLLAGPAGHPLLPADGGDVAPNLLFLGARGLYTTQSGLRIGYLSDALQAGSLAAQLGGAGAPMDLLLLPAPPHAVSLLSPAFAALDPPLVLPPADGWDPVAALLATAAARYIAAPSPRFFEREPFAGPGGSISRCVLLGPVPPDGAKGKQERWFFAAALVPASKMPAAKLRERPANATPNPFAFSSSAGGPSKRPRDDTDAPSSFFFDASAGPAPSGNKRRRGRDAGGDPDVPPEGYICRRCGEPGHYIRLCPARDAPDHGQGHDRPLPDGYVCRICGTPGHRIQDCPSRSDAGPRSHGAPRSRQPQECWFCLSSPTLASHLLISIGGNAYLAAPKGALTGGHAMAVPVGHVGSVAELLRSLAGPDGEAKDEALSVLDEMGRFVAGVGKMELADGNAVALFEAHAGPPTDGRRQAHACVQLVPVPLSLADFGALAGVARREGARAGMEVLEDAGAQDEARWAGVARGAPADPERPYIRLALGGKSITLVPSAPRESEEGLPPRPFAFPFALPRAVLAEVLGLPAAFADWKRCAEGEEREAEAVEGYKVRFAGFDWTAEGE